MVPRRRRGDRPRRRADPHPAGHRQGHRRRRRRARRVRRRARADRRRRPDHRRRSPSARPSSGSAGAASRRCTTCGPGSIAHIHRISLADHNEERRGALVARVTSDIETLAQFFQWGGLAWLLDGPLMLMVAAVMLAYDWILAARRLRRRRAAGDRAARRPAPPRRRLRPGPRAQRRDARRRSPRSSPAPRRSAPTTPATALGGRGRRGDRPSARVAQIRANVIGAFLFPSGEVFSVADRGRGHRRRRRPRPGERADRRGDDRLHLPHLPLPRADRRVHRGARPDADRGRRAAPRARRARPAGRPAAADRPAPAARRAARHRRPRRRRSPTRRAGWPPRSTRPCCATSPRTSRPASRWRSSAPPGRARRRSGG